VGRIWQDSTIRQKVFLKAFGRGICGREYIVIRQKNCSTGESGKHLVIRDDVDWNKEGDELMTGTRWT
jgi:hypothetical protein